MVEDNEKAVPFSEARRQVEIVARRIALLHLSYANAIVKELGDKRGRKLVLKAIKDYGARIAAKMRKGEPDLPDFGVHERVEWVEVHGDRRARVYGCSLAKEWNEWGENALGRLYCYVDPAKSMSFDLREKVGHLKAVPDGDTYCELGFRQTTKQERKDFTDDEADWEYIDKIEP
jgi:hypothetical protein